MHPWERFWQAVERIPGPEAVLTEWRMHVGDDFDATCFPLRPTDRYAAAIPADLDPFHPGSDVVRHANGEWEAIDRQTGSVATIARSDLLIYELERCGVKKGIAEALGIEAPPGSADHVGEYCPFAGVSFPVFLVVQCDPGRFQRAVESIAAQHRRFIVVAPTEQFLRPTVRRILEIVESGCLSLSESIAADAGGRWHLTTQGEDCLSELVGQSVPESRMSNGQVFFETPASSRWSDLEIRFRDGETLTARVGGHSKVLVFSEMGMADGRNKKPTKQWHLLYAFAEASGLLTWESPAASRKNQKRREDLARNLKSFFRIDGDPIVYDPDSKGWRTAFRIEV